jgi:hypothetical protein
VGQYLERTIDENCLYTTVNVGISLDCPLSPVMAAIIDISRHNGPGACAAIWSRWIAAWRPAV